MKLGKTLLLLTMLGLWPAGLHANDIRVKHVALREGIAGSYGLVEFDLSWENSWRNDLEGAGRAAPFNHDAAWVFVKFSTDGGTNWRHATLSSNNSNHRILNDNGVPAILKTGPQGTGIFIFRERNGGGSNDWRDVQLRWQYEADEISSLASPVIAKVIALEMVFIPSGGFFAGDVNPQVVNGQFEDGASGQPFVVKSEGELTLGGGVTGNLGNNNAQGMAHGNDFNDTTTKHLPAGFPKGFAAFYIMKYEITQGQYADFLNLLSSAAAQQRTITGSPDYAAFRGTITGSHPAFSAAAPDRACNFLSWQDGAAYADWAGLRPMTELEFEKAARGKRAAVTGEFAWGNAGITRQTAHNGIDGSGNETASPTGANANFNAGINGPVRAGIFAATAGGVRAQAGASFYGVMELSGNVLERIVTLGNEAGRRFTGTHGDGELSFASGFPGNATNTDWPGINTEAAKGVTGARGSGQRGGAWKDPARLLRLADRAGAATEDDQRANHFGFRCVRTAP